MDPLEVSRSSSPHQPDDPSPVAFTPGQRVFDRYVLAAVLGRGANGFVWRARDEVLERDVALKFLPASLAADPKTVEEFKRETRRALELTHPHIVRIHDFVQDERRAAISMEWIDGSSLAALKRSSPDGCLDWTTVAPWVDGLCSALDHAHAKARIVHRDLKPANILSTRSGSVKIADFGISSSLGETTAPTTGVSASGGTPLYMSPQQMRGDPPHPSDDLYALGATLYELLTGKPPFFSGNIPAQLESVTPPSVQERRRQLGCPPKSPLPPAWENALAACLSKDPALRPASAGALAAALKIDLSDNDPTQATVAVTLPAQVSFTPALVSPPAKPKARPSFPLVAAVTLFVVAAVGYYFGVHRPHTIAQAEAARQSERDLAERGRIARERAEQARLDEAARLRLAETEQALKSKSAEVDARLAALDAADVARATTPASPGAIPPTDPLQTEIARHPWTAIEAWVRAAKRPLWEQPTLAATAEIISAGMSIQQMREALLRQKEFGARSAAMAPQGFGPDTPRETGTDPILASQLKTYSQRLSALHTSAKKVAERYRTDFGLKFRNGTPPDWPDLPAITDDGFAAKILGKAESSAGTTK